MTMESRLRQPGFAGGGGGKRGGKSVRGAERQGGDTSLPPILERGSLPPQPGQQPRLGRAASVGRGGMEDRPRGDHSLPPLGRNVASPGGDRSRGDGHSLPPLKRSASAAPEAHGGSHGHRGSGSRPPRQEAPLADAPPARSNHHRHAGAGSGRGTPTPEPEADFEHSPAPHAQRKPPAAPRSRGRGTGTPGTPTDERQPQAQRQRSSSRRPPAGPGAAASPRQEEPEQPRQIARSSSRGMLQREVPPAPEPKPFPGRRESPRQREPARTPPQRQPPRQRESSQQRSQAPAAREPPYAADSVPPPPPPHEQPRPASPTLKGLGAVKPSQLAQQAERLAQQEFAEEAQDDGGELLPCQHCGRNFRAEMHARHEGICVKVFQKKRKVYNPTEHRLPDDPALAEIKRKAAQQTRKGEVGIGETKQEEPLVKKNAWRAKSEAFRAAMKDAQIVKKFQKEGRPLSELPPPAATAPELDDRTPCPHCGRRFGEQQAARHIPLCNAKKAKAAPKPAAKPPPARNTSKKRAA